jgi:hypothetical protein
VHTEDDMLVDGMTIAVRHRRDFVVTDAERLLTAARQLNRELHPGATDAEEQVTSAADVVYTVLEHAGVIADTVEERLTTPGLDLRGWRSEVTVDEPDRCAPTTTACATTTSSPCRRHAAGSCPTPGMPGARG